jgi:Flp pilus assembly protein TadD
LHNLADELQPDQAGILAMRAITLHSLKRLDEALADSTRAHTLDPSNVDVCCNVGILLLMLCRYNEALRWFDRAIGLRPNFILALNNKASALRHLGRLDDAIATYHFVKTLDPGNAEADLGLGHLQLSVGNFAAGWEGHEARRRIAAAYPDFTQPLWLGEEDIAGKIILICSDEGLGDAIQFARFVPVVAARGARVILVADVPLYPLLSKLSGVSQCVPKVVGPLPAFDLHCPMSSLPVVLKTRLETIPAEVPYLPSPAENLVQAWEDRLGSHDRLRIGLTWSGNPKHRNDHNRSLPLQMLLPVLDVDATFVSLQKDPRLEDEMLLAQTKIINLVGHLSDFTETAALVSCLDLVITVDTSIAHLAGALGRPTWLLLPHVADWRWLLDRDDSPWYPTMRLFRQPEARDYATVLERVRAELSALICKRPDKVQSN